MAEPVAQATDTSGGDVNVTTGEGLNTDGQWYSSLPEGVRDNPNIMKYKSIDDLAQGHINAVQMIGRDKIPMPKTDAEFREVYAKLGMPESADKYEFEQKDYGFDERMYSRERQEQDLGWWREQAHELGLSKSQAAKVYDAYMSREAAGVGAMSKAVEAEVHKAESTLRAEWGEAYEGNITIANRGMTKLFGPGVTDAIIASGLGRNPDFVRGMHKFGMSALEDLGIDKRGTAARTPNQLAEEVAELQGHPAYFDRAHPEHDFIVERVYALQKRLYPEAM